MSKKIKIASLFSGIGGFEFGIKNALGADNVEVVFASEIDKYAAAAYAHLHGAIPHGDITKIEGKDIPDHDILVGGFPCQSFSVAGKREGFKDKTRGTLFFDVARVIQEKQPSFFILENVKGLVSHDKGKTFDIIKETLWDLGYIIHFKILNTKNFGLPQNRERIFIVGSKDENFDFEFPQEQPLEIQLKDLLEETVEEKFFLSKERVAKFKERKSGKDIKTVGNCSNYNSQAVISPEGISPTLTVCDYKQIIVRGDLQDCNFEQLNRIYDFEGISPTLTCRSDTCKIYIDEKPFRIRKLTPLECFRLQGFPDGAFYELKEQGFSNTQLYKMAGNAVSTTVIQAIFGQLKKQL